MGRRRPAWQLARGRRASPGRIIVVLFCIKYTRQIKPRILKLNIRRGQSNFNIAFIYVVVKEKVFKKGDYYVVPVGQVSFGWRSYCVGRCVFFFGLFVFLQRTAEKCSKIQNACTEPFLCLLNLLFGNVQTLLASLPWFPKTP